MGLNRRYAWALAPVLRRRDAAAIHISEHFTRVVGACDDRSKKSVAGKT
jgi:hypothetical protein